MNPSPAPMVPKASPLTLSPTPLEPPSRLHSLAALLEDRLLRQRDRNQLRSRRLLQVVDATHVRVDGRLCINFASNNYLGLTHHPRLISQAESLSEGAGSGAAGLVSGYTEAHASAEARIARWKGTESAVLLPSGYQANLAAIQTFAALSGETRVGVRFLIDKLAHASLIDAVRASGSPFRVFPHNHLGKLRRLLSDAAPSQLQVVITESIFSMDGDAADLQGLAALKRERPFALFVDEAHACGVYGEGGSGLLSALGMPDLADVLVCTFSKAAGGAGGAVCGSKQFCEALVNFGRAYIYSTAVPPNVARAAITAIEIMQEEPFHQRRVNAIARDLRQRLMRAGLNIPMGNSPIIPVIIGEENATLMAAERLLAAGIFVTAIRPPTVAPGTARLRLTLSSEHTDAEIDHLILHVLKLITPVVADLQGQTTS